jgi:hypothetical protein
VQQCGNGEIFIASSFENERRDSDEMCDVGNGRGLAGLALVFLGGELKGAEEARTEFDRRVWRFPPTSFASSCDARRARGTAKCYSFPGHCFSPRRANR